MERAFAKTGFTAAFRIDFSGAAADEPLCDAGAFRIAIRMAGRDPDLARYDRDGGNYLNFPLPDGSCPVVEAAMDGLRVGIPLGLLARPDGTHDVVVNLADTHFSIAVDGHVDDDMLSAPAPARPLSGPETLSPRVASVRVSSPALPDALGRVPDSRPVRRSVQYWTPDGRIGMKWVPEIAPPVPPRTFRSEAGVPFERRFAREDGGPALVLRVDPAKREAALFDDSPAPVFDERWKADNVRIGALRGVGGAYDVRVVVWYDPKADATIFDAEIAGGRTLVCRRRGRYRD